MDSRTSKSMDSGVALRVFLSPSTILLSRQLKLNRIELHTPYDEHSGVLLGESAFEARWHLGFTDSLLKYSPCCLQLPCDLHFRTWKRGASAKGKHGSCGPKPPSLHSMRQSIHHLKPPFIGTQHDMECVFGSSIDSWFGYTVALPCLFLR